MYSQNILKGSVSWVVTLFLLGTGAAFACQAAAGTEPVHAAKHHLVLFNGPVSELESAVMNAGATLDRVWAPIGVARVSGLSDAAAAGLAKTDGIRCVERDITMQWIDGFTPGRTVAVQYAPAEDGEDAGRPTFASVQWNMTQIEAKSAQHVTRGTPGTRVAIISTGISPGHIDLQGRYDLKSSVNLSSSNPSDLRDFQDRHMQGTVLSALIASNSVGMESVAPNVTLVGIKAFGDDGRASFSNLIDAIMYAADAARADVIDIGVDHAPGDARHLPLMEMLNLAVRHAIDKGVFVVASVGNCRERDSSDAFARAFSSAGALMIGASLRSENGECGAVASYGGSTSEICLYAPGGGRSCADNTFGSISDMVVSALSPEVARRMDLPQPEAWYVFSSSAAIASAHVAGVAALLKSITGNASPASLVNRILRSAQQPKDPSRRGELSASFAAKR